MKQIRKTGIYVLLMVVLTACGLNENEAFNQKYIHIMLNETSSTTVNAKAKTLGEYKVYLSSAMYTGSVTLTYRTEVGDGLKEGVDFEYVSKGNSLVFMSGIFEMPVRIQWLPNTKLDPQKNNTIKIILVSNDRGYAIGMPGPDHVQSEFVITKVL